MKKIILLSFYLLLTFLLIVKVSFAADYQIEYRTEYTPKKNETGFLTEVFLHIKIIHLRSDIYVKSLTLKFPDLFTISNLKGKDDNNALDIIYEKKDNFNSITLNLINPNVGKNSANNIYLFFTQDKIFKEIGNIWEALIPIIVDENQTFYQVTINIPKEVNKPISIAKPLPTRIENSASSSKIFWENPKNKIIYAIFGKEQFYQFKIQYTLANEKLIPVIQEITLLPDTAYQKVYHNQLHPSPMSVIIDEDGNFLAQYLLKPKEIKKINYKGMVVITSLLNEEKVLYDRKLIEKQKNYLLAGKTYWEVDNLPSLENNLPQTVYHYVVKKLQYDFKNISNTPRRLGANKALQNPNKALCLEFSDLFIALAREKGILSRQVIGYAYSQEERLRPLFLLGDILHAWVEYYDFSSNLWKQIDPTWENTSGIDYFNSLDLNHVAFVIRGKDPDYPLPPGSFKLPSDVDKQDIIINVTSEKPREIIKFEVLKENFPSKIFIGEKKQSRLIIKNLSNRIFYQLPINLEGENFVFDKNTQLIDIFPPFAQREISFNFSPKRTVKTKKTKLLIEVGKFNKIEKEIEILPVTKNIYYFAVFIFSTTTAIFLFLQLKKILKRND